MQVILLERIGKLGQMGDVVSVRPGYARNFLLPQGKALRASDENIKGFEARKAELESKNAESRELAQKSGDKLNGASFIIIRAASEAGALYGSVTPRDIATAAGEAGHEVDRKQVILAAPVKELGLHQVKVALHPEVEAEISINVARSVEEAELQASGKSIQQLAAEAEAEAEFELAELFDDLGAAAAEDSELVDVPEDESQQDAAPAESDESEE